MPSPSNRYFLMRVTLRSFAAAVAILAVAACSDSNTAPRTASSFRATDRPTLDLSLGNLQFGTDFTLTRSGGTFPISGGLYTVVFPADAVCDPTISTYGPSQW